jgi:hypothetical protein
MSVPLDKDLYAKAKATADEVYGKKTSGFKSGFLVQEYKRLGGRYKQTSGSKKSNPLARWFDEQWKDVGDKKYPVFRPTKRVSSSTPLLPTEIDPRNLKEQIALKQKIKGSKNLPPFKKAKKKTDA